MAGDVVATTSRNAIPRRSITGDDEMYQLVRIVENGWAAKDYTEVGPRFETESGVVDYVYSVIPTSQWWEMVVFTYGDDDEVYGGAELLESEDLQEWLSAWGDC